MSFLRLGNAFFRSPDDLRTAALAHLGDSNAARQYAAVYALALTAAPGPAADQLTTLLKSRNLTEQAIAAAALTRIGLKQGLPVLIADLSVKDGLSFWNPPKPFWELSRAVLLANTDRDFGLARATTASAAALTKKNWQRWWTTYGASLVWDAASQRFVTPGAGLIRPADVKAASTEARASSGRRAGASPAGTQVTTSGNTVTLTVPIDLITPSSVKVGKSSMSAEQLAKAWKDGAESKWNAAFKKYHYHGCASAGKSGLQFRLNIQMHVYPLSLDVDPPNDGFHHVVVEDMTYWRSWNDHGHVDNGTYYEQGSQSAWWGGASTAEIAHEVGHLVGFGDDYYDKNLPNGRRTSISFKSREGTLMAASPDDYSEAKIDRALIDRLGNLLRDIGRLRCKRPAKPNPWYGRANVVYDLKTTDPNAHYPFTEDSSKLTVTIPRAGPPLWDGQFKYVVVESTYCRQEPSGNEVPYVDTTTDEGVGHGVVKDPETLLILSPESRIYELDIGGGVIFGTETKKGVLSGDDCAPLPADVHPITGGPHGAILSGDDAQRLARGARVLRGSVHKNLGANGSDGSKITGGWTATWIFRRNTTK
jgi:hypothetical protein